MINHIWIKDVYTPYKYFENYWFIDGKSLPQYLENWSKESQDKYLKSIRKFIGLCPAWNKNIAQKGDVRFVWNLIEENSAVLPVLLCEDDTDFSFIVIVVDVEKTNDFVYWNRIGYVLHDKEDFEEEKRNGILNTESYSPEDWEMYGDNIALESVDSPEWLQWIGANWDEELYRRRMNYTAPFYRTEGNVCWIREVSWKFSRAEYEDMVTAFWEIQTLKQLNNISSKKVINVVECAELLADLTIYGRGLLDKHIREYEGILLHVLSEQLVTEPLISLLKYHPERKCAIDIYYKIIEVMSQNGTDEVRNVVDVTILERISGEKEIWKLIGPHLTKLTERKEIKRRKRLEKYLFIFLGLVLICFLAKRYLPIGRTDFKSIEQFEKLGGYVWREGLPEGTQDVRYYLTDTMFFTQSIYSFTIEDEEQYDAFMEVVREHSCYESAVEYPGWAHSCNVSLEYSKEEQEAMRYLQENHKNMDYKEVLRLASAHKRGFASSYGADVEDYVGEENGLDDFPLGLSFQEVIPDNIYDYTILDFSPMGTGSVEDGILVNQDTHRFVIYYAGQIR